MVFSDLFSSSFFNMYRRKIESGPPEIAAITVSFAEMYLFSFASALSSSFFSSWGFIVFGT